MREFQLRQQPVEIKGDVRVRKHQVVPQNFLPKPAALIFGAFAALTFGTALADPPDRVARLSYESGTVTFEPAGTQDWVQATPNRPLITGDGLWVDASSRAELNVGRAALRADTQTSISITNLDDRVAQFQLAQGTVELTVRSMGPDAVYEIDTPNLALTINQPGQYRVTVTPDGQTTYALVRQGSATASGDNQSYAIGANQSYSFAGTDLSNYTYYDPPAPDDFDRFSADRDARWVHSSSQRYVSPEMIGYEDLDANGTWQVAEGYGNVWVPNNVGPDWAPYQAGHWAWVSPWGWTWVDDAAWGFAPFHYGRWAHVGFGWAWIPGPVEVAPVYAPALVAFVGGGGGFSLAVGGGGGGIGVAWFPLGPREVYRPGYEVSPAYVQRVNVTNTVVTTTVVNNVYNNTTVVHYANQSVPNAVTAVPQNAFASGQSVSRVAIHVAPSAVANQPVGSIAAVVPTQRAVSGPGAISNFRPSAAAMARPVVARTAPPPPPVAFAAKQQALAANPGRPVPPAIEQQLQRSTAPAVQRPQPHVVSAPAQAAVAPPPRAATGANAPRPGGFTPAAGPPAVNRPTGIPTAGLARPPEATNPGRPVAAPGVPQQRAIEPVRPVEPAAREAVPQPARPAVAPQALQPNPVQRQEAPRPRPEPGEKNEKERKDER
jgi:hypothetical protein